MSKRDSRGRWIAQDDQPAARPTVAPIMATQAQATSSQSPAHVFTQTVRAFMATGLALIVMIWLGAWLWMQVVHSPGDTYKPIPAGQIKSGVASGPVCGTHGPVVQAWVSTDIPGATLYGVRCQDGITLQTGQP